MPTPTPSGDAAHLQALLDDRLAEIRRQVTENRRVRAMNETLRATIEAQSAVIANLRDKVGMARVRESIICSELRNLVDRCDCAPLADGSNIDTAAARAALGELTHPEPAGPGAPTED